MSLRRRLTLSLVTILVLFAGNVGTHFWGSYARNESMIAYRDSVSAAQLSTAVEQLLEDRKGLDPVHSTSYTHTDNFYSTPFNHVQHVTVSFWLALA